MWQVKNILKNDTQLFRTELEADNFIASNPAYNKTEVDCPEGEYTQLTLKLTFDKTSIIPLITFKTLKVDRDYRPEIFLEENEDKTILKAYVYYLNEDYSEAFKEVFTTLLTPLFNQLKSQSLTRVEKSQKITTAFASIAEDKLDGYIKKRKGF